MLENIFFTLGIVSYIFPIIILIGFCFIAYKIFFKSKNIINEKIKVGTQKMGKFKKPIYKGIRDNGIFASSLFLEQNDKLFKFLEGTAPHEYSQIMDKVYNQTHIGGGFHRTFDGAHTLKGSYDAIKDKVGEVDPVQYVEAHARELVTPEGIPILTLDKSQHEALSNDIAETLGGGITAGDIRAYHRDINSFNAGELCSAGLGTVFVAAAIHSGDPKAISRVTASNLCMGIATGNPVMLLVGTASLAHGVANGKIQAWELLKGAAPAIAGIIGYQAASELFSFGKGGSIVFAIGTSIATNALIAKMEARNREKIIEELGEDNPQYIAAITSTILKEEIAKQSRKSDPLSMGGRI